MSQTKFPIDKVADTHHRIHWNNHLSLLQQVEEFESYSELASPQEYVLGPNRMVGFVKQCLINVETIDDIRNEIDQTMQCYEALQPIPGPLFRQQGMNMYL